MEISKKIDTPIRKFGSASLDIVNVACGRFDGFWQRELNYWDIAAAEIILKESGGYIENFELQEKDLNKKNIIASNSLIHTDLLSLITKKNIV